MLIAAILGGYLLGSVSVAVLLTREKYGGDVREKGSGNAGATNVARVFGFGAGLLTLGGDAVKTALAMLLGKLLCGDLGAAAAAAGCLVGHCWPLYFGFRGGKAVTVSGAISLFLNWRLTVILFVVFALVFALSKRVSLCSISAAVAYPLAMLALGSFAWFQLALGCFVSVIVLFMHRTNIQRLLKGTEPKFHAKSK